jgi:hypothetical protein
MDFVFLTYYFLISFLLGLFFDMAKITPESFEEICSDLEKTWEGLFALCKKHNVDRSCFYDYKDKNKN